MTESPLREVSNRKGNKPQYRLPVARWDNIMTLLGLMVVANGRVTEEEVNEFVDSMMELRVVIDPKVSLTRHFAMDWLKLNKDHLSAIIDGLEYDREIIAILSDIRSLPYKLDIITAMVRIAIADNDYSRIEKGFIKKTILYWNIRAQENQKTAVTMAETGSLREPA